MTDQDRYYDSAAETTRAHRLDEAATEMAVARRVLTAREEAQVRAQYAKLAALIGRDRAQAAVTGCAFAPATNAQPGAAS